MSSIGVDAARVDGPAKVRGAAEYTADIELAGMVYVKALRSTNPHAKLLRVDASKAAKSPEVVAVLTRDDLKGMNAYFGPVVKDHAAPRPAAAQHRVRSRKDPQPPAGAGNQRRRPDTVRLRRRQQGAGRRDAPARGGKADHGNPGSGL